MTIEFDPAAPLIPNGLMDLAQEDRRRRRAARQLAAAPVDRLTPRLAEAPAMAQVLEAVLSKLQSTVRLLQDLPQWASEASPGALGMHTATEAPLKAIIGHADRLSTALEALRRYSAIDGHQVTLAEVDATPLITDIITRKLALRPGPLDLQVEVPRMRLDPLLIRGIAAGLTDAAITDARRAEDKIGFRALVAQDSLRLSVIHAGPPFDPGALTTLFQAQGAAADAQHPAAALGLAFVWRATALLSGTLEVGAGFMGAGARITVVLPRS